MLPPKRVQYKHGRRHWECATCGAVLGRLATAPTGEKLLKVRPALFLVRMHGPSEWELICEQGHSTIWQGTGIRLERSEAA